MYILMNHLQVTKCQIMDADHRFLSLALPEHGRGMSAEGHRCRRQQIWALHENMVTVVSLMNGVFYQCRSSMSATSATFIAT